jgi:hypothetical protein
MQRACLQKQKKGTLILQNMACKSHKKKYFIGIKEVSRNNFKL